MTRDFAIRIDSLLAGVRGSLDSINSYMKNNIARNNISQEEYEEFVALIGRAMTETIKISWSLCDRFPDIVPDELKSDPRKA
jgi:hypothetical protein